MAALLLPATLLVLGLLVAPMAMLFRISLNEYSAAQMMQEALTAENYLRAIADPYYRDVLGTTLGVALACTLLALLLGFPAAYWLARMQSRWKSLAVILTLFPLLVGNVVRAAGWMALLGRDGAINAALRSLGLITEPLALLYTTGAVIAGILAVVAPYMILTLAAVIEGIPRQVEEAAANLGAGPLTGFRRVVLPLALPGVAAGCVLVFILCMNAYATPVLLGGPQFKMMAPAVYDQFVRGTNWPFGAALAFILLVVTLTLTIIGSTVLGRHSRSR
ncbi:ABC transporter permease [Belnapia rosea]|uniref:Putative spermidine/putrescine transport system permease protein n=1 Tax=Belnapia rosea TaxID=938405 RepID=A0A1G6KQ76_9PROT|nr:ABC transporter permease [Belnapia rosea]SDB20071.1 putative spermidine/putrescine transport system permease protein [Belnapia rosea]SDC33057.1 putative spermidine/putrescine transport system permease protein [Belnapia rosea]